MVKIRLTRVGSRSNPHYRLIAISVRSKRDTKALEVLGYYNPKTKEVRLEKDRIIEWRRKGAQLTETVARLLKEKPKRDYSKNKKIQEKGKEETPTKTEKKLKKILR